MLTDAEAQEVAAILDDSLALMNEDGSHWTQGRYEGVNDLNEPNYCSVGAIWRASANRIPEESSYIHKYQLHEKRAFLITQAVRAVAEAYRSAPVEGGYDSIVIQWNDRADTTWEKVVKRFTRARERVLKNAQS